MSDDFDPQRAALFHAARAERENSGQHALSEAALALACGLIYVGDQVRDLGLVTDEPDPPSAVRVTEPRSPLVGARVVGWDHGGGGGVLVQHDSGSTYRIGVGMPFELPAKVTGFSPDEELVAALRRIRDHAEEFGSGPVDDEMREIARRALEVCDGGTGE